MPTGHDFIERVNLPMQADMLLVNRLVTELLVRLDAHAKNCGFILDWSGLCLETEENRVVNDTLTGPVHIASTTTITASVRGIKPDEDNEND